MIELRSFGQRALVTREAARRAVSTLLADQAVLSSIDLDFSGVEAVSPSFVDELLSKLFPAGEHLERVVRFVSPPRRLPNQILAIGRGRKLRIVESPTGDWVVSRVATTDKPRV
ncbi:MAG: hypothetical protein WD934_06580 [Gemmatimonadales bacterium]